MVLLAACAVAGLALRAGFELRRWAWVQTDPIHFYPDMTNGVHWGRQGNEPAGNPRGFLNVYDLVAGSAPMRGDDTPQYRLDYAPLRLLLITRWEKWAAEKYPQITQQAYESDDDDRKGAWHPPYDFYEPLLHFNDATEIAAAIGLFLLTRHWVIRGDRRWGSCCPATGWGAMCRPFRGCFAGGVAALLFWFNPAVILSTHGWPTWDEWIIPFFVWTVWLCCIDWWFAAGLLLAIGAMFKGQQLFVAPMFILWPLLIGRPMAALRWVAGLLIGIALIASPWLLSYVPGEVTVTSVPSDRVIDRAAVCFVIAVILLMLLPLAITLWLGIRRRHQEIIEEAPRKRFIRWTIATIGWLRPMYAPLAAISIASALLLCARYFHGSLNWLYIGWGYGTRHYFNMVTGLSDNLAGLLSHRFGWDKLWFLVYTFDAHPTRFWPMHDVLFAEPTPITIRQVLITLYVIGFLCCVVGMAIQYRRNDPRFLVAMTGTWVMFFTLLPQIHERYLLYAAGAGCSLAAVGVGFVLLDLFMTVLTFMMTLHVMLTVAGDNGELNHFATQISPTFSHLLYRDINRTFPDAAWAMLLCAAVFLYQSIAPSRSPMRRHE